ncbi:MAG: flagellar basal body P-ring protein FlgI [Burkholderiales bacterium]|nr:flagellar basal body P-ring protein FlgI [Burkholderiales bacterium]
MTGFRARLKAALGALTVGFALAAAGPAHAQRIKDLASVQGVRSNQLIGYGLVVGLDGSGDQTTQTPFTVQSITAMLSQLGVNLPPGTNLQLRNVAAVMATAVLPPFARPGQQVDVTVSSLGNARSLRGGTLLLTPLRGADGRIYGMAQGNVVVAGAGAAAGGSGVKINQLNSGRIPSGATVEQEVPTPVGQGEYVNLELHGTDFATAGLIAEAINRRAPGAAAALDGRVVQVRAPRDSNERVAFLAMVNELAVDAPAPAAKVIINARTGSVVMNRAVMLEEAAVAHGSLSVAISSDPVVSQPNPFGSGQTVVTERTRVQIQQEGGQLVHVPASAKLVDVVSALNAMGATPTDLLAILQALKAAGSLKAELEII